MKSYPKRKGKPLSPTERMVDSTVSEWYSEKHRRPTAKEEKKKTIRDLANNA